MSCNDLKWSYRDAESKLNERSRELESAESRRSQLTSRHSELTNQLNAHETRISQLESQLWNADGQRRATLLMELEAEKRDRDGVSSERASVDGSLRSVRSRISELQQGIASARQATERLRSQWQSEGCEGRIDW
ncbi:hypothetical protein [Salinarimonas ramus]|uniref:Uncharacterized protein n=1 Tax=Salinarimonas ramus TaxID=690164 RepID=A0A917Q565_9HYPH|nr:hypothetical protein [Salinarimonas ramus]GGK22354.1 hypothetical protein GCM10011322_06270 [Salinarimonas ramus]